ncbi:MAG: IS256 family transposase [Victivallales bacterium]|jgi:putative transposase|nr:IS256 family transposase [Victivallales bacterium]
MADATLRHVHALLEEIRNDGMPKHVLKRALEAVLSALMEDEVSEQTGAGYGERSELRVVRRNGYRDRTFQSGLGTSLLQIPKLRQGTYMPSFLKAHQRSDDALVMAVAECYQQGVSTRNVESIAQALGVESLKKSTVSKMAEALEPQVDAFRKRSLPACPYVYVDARYEHVREDHRVQKMAVMIAIGVREDGIREVLGYRVARVENEAFWSDFLLDLKKRGLSGVRLVVSDAHEGLKKAIRKTFPSALWQRCKVHFLRNLSGRVPRKKRPALVSLAKTIFEQDTAEDARTHRELVGDFYRQAGMHEAADTLDASEDVLRYMDMPPAHWTKLHSTNVLERLNREIKRRTRVVSIFPNRKSLDRLVGALLLEEHEEWMVGRRYMSERSMNLLKTNAQQLEEMAPGGGLLLEAARRPGARGPLGEETQIAAQAAE